MLQTSPSSLNSRIALNPDTHIAVEIPFHLAGSGVIALGIFLFTIVRLFAEYRVNTENLANSLKQLERRTEGLSEKTAELSGVIEKHSIEIELHKQSIGSLERQQGATNCPN